MTNKSLLTYFIALFAMCSHFTMNAQCDPDPTPPTIVGCLSLDTTIYITDPGACTVADPFPDVTFTEDCSVTNVLATSSLPKFSFLMGPGGGTITTPILFGTDSIAIFGISDGTLGINSQVNYCFYAYCASTLTFDFRASMSNGDDFPLDRARIMIENAVTGTSTVTVLTPGTGSALLGSQTIALSKGDRVCFEVNSDNTLGVDTLFLKNVLLTAVGDPEPMYHGYLPGVEFTCNEQFPAFTYALNCAGLISVCFNSITVIDTTKPIITGCPANQIIQLGPTECDRVVTWAEPTVEDPCLFGSDFVGPFEAGLWTNNLYVPFDNPSNGLGIDAIIVHEPSILAITAANNGVPNTDQQTSVSRRIPCNGTITFNWSASIPEPGAFRADEAGYISGASASSTTLSLPLGANSASGTVAAYPVAAGDYIGFWVNSDNLGFETTLEITGFVFTPDPATILQTAGPAPGTALAPGHYDVQYDASSCCGNRVCTFSIDVIANSTMACKDLNVSLDANCEALITADAVLTSSCPERAKVYLTHYGKPVPNPVDSHYLGQTITATVVDTVTGNSCWSFITIEDKLAPTIICENDTMSCYRFENLVTPGIVEDCSKYSVRLLDELTEKLDCDEDYIKRITRVWITEDLSNQLTDTCTQQILIERFNFDSLYFPSTDVTLYCQDLYRKDAAGHPHPYVTGVPTYGFWRDTIWPTTDFLCNVATDYVDTDLGEIRCVRKIMRNWRVREWWCNQEITRNWTQFIQIKDTVGPRIIHGIYDFHATTGHKSCHADVTLPPIEAIDDCHQLLSVDVVYPGGILKNQNGGRVLLPVGYDTIIYRLYDNCYNLSTDTLIVTVKDDTEPVAICDRRTVVSLNQNGTIWVPAEVFDDGSFDECHLHHFEVRRMDDNSCGTTGPDDWGPEVGFCCEDVGTERMVAFKAIDFSGNESVCMVLVEVQDKDIPSIVCPPDITIDCRFPIDLNHLEVFGRVVTSQAARKPIVIDTAYYHVIGGHPQDGLALDNCNPNVTEEPDFSNMDQCGQGYILRWFYVTDRQGNRVRCHQTITIVNHHPFDETSIVWPPDYEGIHCNVGLYDPSLLPAPYNRPTYSDDVCSLVGVSYKDHVFAATVPGDPCFKIFRVWKVIDWCHKDVYGDFMIFSDTQVIKINNFIDPVIRKACRDTTICTYDVECRPIAVRLAIEADDDCTRPEELLYRYKIDLNSDGTIDIEKASIGDPVASGTWPLGRHIIKWEVEDRCGNTAKCQSQLNLINCKTPTAYCHRDVSVGLVAMDLNGDGVPDTKMVQVWASDIDAGSSHNCGYPVKLSFSRDTADKSRTYNCDSLGLRNVELWVTDINGNTSVCKTRIIVWDNPQNAPRCPNTLNSGIDGLITTESGSKVQSVEVLAEGANTQSTLTNFDGVYDFGTIASGADYLVLPKRNDDWLNGVTTADIVKIQKHILGIEVFTSPYKMIAADVNNSKSITAKDISDIRKMILGVTNTIANSTSWKFVDQLYQFKNIDQTLEENYPQNYQITNLNSKMNINFYGIKLGDVNESAKTRGLSSNVITRSDKSLNLETENVKLAKGEVHEIVVRATNIQEFEGMQFTLQFNPQLLKIVEINGNELISLHTDNFNLQNIENGLISMSWNGQVSNNEELFTIKVKANSELNLVDAIFLGSSLTPALAVGNDDQEYPVNLNFKGAGANEFVLLQNEPNPWKSNTVIGMYLPRTGEVKISIHDIHGKLLYMAEKELQKGYQEWTIEKSILNTGGVYYYQVDFENNTQTKKMIVID